MDFPQWILLIILFEALCFAATYVLIQPLKGKAFGVYVIVTLLILPISVVSLGLPVLPITYILFGHFSPHFKSPGGGEAIYVYSILNGFLISPAVAFAGLVEAICKRTGRSRTRSRIAAGLSFLAFTFFGAWLIGLSLFTHH